MIIQLERQVHSIIKVNVQLPEGDEIDEKFHNRMCGKLLGDERIVKQDRRLPRFEFQHRILDYDWANYYYHQLKNTFPLNLPVYKKSMDSRLQKVIRSLTLSNLKQIK